ANPTAPQVLAHCMGWRPGTSQWQRLNVDTQSNLLVALKDNSGTVIVGQTQGDGVSASSNGLVVCAVPGLWNGTTADRERANLNATLLASAARTSTTAAADQTNYNGLA